MVGEDPALVAHRYALAIPGVDTVVLGVKNRRELEQCLHAERLGPLEPELVARVDALGLLESAVHGVPGKYRAFDARRVLPDPGEHRQFPQMIRLLVRL